MIGKIELWNAQSWKKRNAVYLITCWYKKEMEWNSQIANKRKQLDVDPRRDDDASPMSSYRCMLRPTWMFMDRMIAPINVHSIS